MAAELTKALPDVRVEMQASSGGRFEVYRDGQPIFQKSKLRRHPEPGEILRLLSAREDTAT